MHQITFKLYATLGDYLPADKRQGNMMPLAVATDASIADIIAPFGLPPKLVHLVLVNGVFIPPEERTTRRLTDGDVLAIWPPVAGG